MSRTSSTGCTDNSDLAGRLPATDAVCSGHGTLPITMRQELHMKRMKKPEVWIRQKKRSLSQGRAASSLMVLTFKICIFGGVSEFVSQKSWRLNAVAST